MQRAASRTANGRHRRPKQSDRVVLALKITTFVLLAGLVGMVVLLFTDEPASRPAAGQSPAVPTITPSREGDRPSVAPTEPSVPPVIEEPEMQTRTADIVATPSTTTTTSAAPPPQPAPPPIQYAVIGERCDDPGAFSITREQETVMCVRSSRGSFRWRQVF
ncbi:hypothetical protein [Actinophytocola sp.]|uniref:hypothetical protein n=1 Tax=Actinophytocola sp. TaxID=1872138 RepID=UPI002D7FBA09|nr:hypothetical protein [Actinophytocola sp.]HET9142198.1 hypothetical protein [Actinophytocola sp.]